MGDWRDTCGMGTRNMLADDELYFGQEMAGANDGMRAAAAATSGCRAGWLTSRAPEPMPWSGYYGDDCQVSSHSQQQQQQQHQAAVMAAAAAAAAACYQSQGIPQRLLPDI